MKIIKDNFDEQYRVYDSNNQILYIVPSLEIALHYVVIDLTEKVEQLEEKFDKLDNKFDAMIQESKENVYQDFPIMKELIERIEWVENKPLHPEGINYER